MRLDQQRFCVKTSLGGCRGRLEGSGCRLGIIIINDLT